MTTAKAEDLHENEASPSESKKHVSERGPFEIWENPEITPTYVHDEIQDIDPAVIAETFEYSALAEEFGEEAAQNRISDLVKASASGTSSTILFGQQTPGGMSLVHVWFGANFPLFRHSHPAYGDCLYYVIHGELLMGKRRLGPGSGMFVPNGHPYKFTAGPAGVELLEFRAGGGIDGAPGLKMEERSLDAIQKLIDEHHVQRPQWHQPEKIGDTAYVQQELDLG
jgi:hypothetical protein